MADADAHAPVVLAAMGIEGADAVVAPGAAAGLDAHLGGREVEFVIEDDQVGRGKLVKAHRLADRLAGQVHEGLRLDQQHLFAADATFGDQALELSRPGRKGMAAGYRVRRHEADIMPVVLVFRAGIAEACDQQHDGRLPAGEDYSSPSSSTASLSSLLRPAGAAMVAMVKSRSVMVGFTSFGRATAEMWMESPSSVPVRSTSMESGIALAGTCASISWRTTLSTPPRLMPGDFSSLRK